MFNLLLFWTRWLKKIHKLVLHSWIGPFMIAFSVILFILVLQFITKYTDELFGRGVEGLVIARVFFYAAVTLVPLALPLAVLLSSLLTMGNMGERYELAALKSGGISLFKIMRPLTYGALVLFGGALLFSFYVVPSANLKLYTLIHDINKVRPSFALKQNHFYSGIDNMVIHVANINRETDVLYKIKIYDHTDKVGNNRVTLADSGKIIPSKAAGHLKMDLYHGVIHEALPRTPGDTVEIKHNRFYFDTLQYQVRMAGFDLEESEGSIFTPHHYMKDIDELYHDVDSLKDRSAATTQDLTKYMVRYNHLDTINKPDAPETREYDKQDTIIYDPDLPIKVDLAGNSVVKWFPMVKREDIYNKAIQQTRAVSNYSNIIADRRERIELKKRKFASELHARYSLPTSIIVFLFLGAPLGAIIRKGGVGLPVIFSIVFFIIFYIFMIQGKKFARDDILPVWMGIWLPNLVLSPLAVWFTWASAKDKSILSKAGWWKLFRYLRLPFVWLGVSKPKKKVIRKTMSIEDLIAVRERRKEVARRRLDEFQKRKEEETADRGRRSRFSRKSNPDP